MEDGETQTPKTLTELIYIMLDNALDYGISEDIFWEMTIAEVKRKVMSAIRVNKIMARERATYDYIHANLVIAGVYRALGDKNEFPTIEQAYPGLFEDIAEKREERLQEQKMSLSALRFKQFAQSYNNSFKNKGVAKDK